MIVAPVHTTRASQPVALTSPPAPNKGEVSISRGADGVDQITGTVPEGATGPLWSVWARLGGLILDLPGAIKVSSSSKTPNIVTSEFESPEFAALARSVVNDTIDGVSMIMTSPADRKLPPHPGGQYWWNWWESPSNQLRAVNGLKGVIFSSRSATGAQFYVDNDEQLGLLKELLRKQLPTGEYMSFMRMPHPTPRPTKVPPPVIVS